MFGYLFSYLFGCDCLRFGLYVCCLVNVMFWVWDDCWMTLFRFCWWVSATCSFCCACCFWLLFTVWGLWFGRLWMFIAWDVAWVLVVCYYLGFDVVVLLIVYLLMYDCGLAMCLNVDLLDYTVLWISCFCFLLDCFIITFGWFLLFFAFVDRLVF